MEYRFEYVLLDRKTVNEIIRVLHKPEPSGYGTLPGKNMNVAWGVHECNTDIILIKGYEPDKKEWKGFKGTHSVVFNVMSREGCFGVSYETNAKGENTDSAKVFYNRDDFYEVHYLDAVKKAIVFYEKEGHKNGAFEQFKQQFESTHNMSLEAYCIQQYQEIYDEWNKKWEHN